MCSGLFTHTVSVPMPMSVTVKIFHCVNGDGPSEGQIGFGTHSVHQAVRLHLHNNKLTDMGKETLCVKRPLTKP